MPKELKPHRIRTYQRLAFVTIAMSVSAGSFASVASAAPSSPTVGGACTNTQRNTVVQTPLGQLRCQASGKSSTWKSVAPKATNAPKLSDKDLAAIVGTWRTTTESQAGYRMREIFVGAVAKSDAIGRTKEVKGTVEIGAVNGSAFVRSVQIAVDMTRVTSDKDLRDDWLKTAGLETNTYKTATFETTAPIAAALPGEGQVLKTQVPGQLTIHGATKPVMIAVEARRTGDIVDVVGSARVTLADFNIATPVIPGVVSTDDTGVMEFALVLRRS
jgi:polyisoprenoid-binding protein YceI